MSEWYTITDKDDVDISDDGQNVDILFNTNDFGNQYVQVPIDIIANVLPHRKDLELNKKMLARQCDMAREAETALAESRRLNHVAFNALRSYQYGNSSTELAEDVANSIEIYLRAAVEKEDG